MLYLNIYFGLLLLFSSLYSTTMFNSVGNIIIAVLIASFVFLAGVLPSRGNLKVHTGSFVLFYLYLISVTISSFANSDLTLFINAAVFFLLYLVSTSGMAYIKTNANHLLYKNAFATHLPLVFIPFLFTGISQGSYSGIFYNPNSFGSVVATLFAFSIATFLYKVESNFVGNDEYKEGTKTHFMFLLVLAFLIVLSGSRTSAVTALAISLIGFILFFKAVIKNGKGKTFLKMVVTSLFSFGVILSVIRLTPFYDYLYNNIINKFILKASSGDVLDQREIVWEQTIREAELFGNGRDYFINQTQVGAHSTYFAILGENGWIPFILFVLILLLILRKNYRYAKLNNDSQYKYLPLFITLSFLLLSFAEGMMFKLSMISMFFAFGDTINEKQPETQKRSLPKIAFKRYKLKFR